MQIAEQPVHFAATVMSFIRLGLVKLWDVNWTVYFIKK